MTAEQNRRQKALVILGGLKCNGLSFIDGPECPIPPNLLQEYDLNISHRKSVGKERPIRLHTEVLAMKNPEKKFILLCCLCNQRMRHLRKEFGFIKFPKSVIARYNSGQSLEEISESFDCSYQAVSNFLKRNNVALRVRGATGGQKAWGKRKSRLALLKERKRRFLTPERVKLAKEVNAVYDEGDSIREVAQWFGISKGAVNSMLRLESH